MKGKKNERKVILILAIALILMAVGFATYETTLYYGGGSSGSGNTTSITANKWQIIYVEDSLQETEGSVTPTTAANLTATDFTFAVTLAKPGDFYEATWTVKNNGTYNAKMDAITMLPALTAAQQNYLTYTVTYDGTNYSGSASSLNHTIAANTTKTIKLRIEFKSNTTAANLPENGDSLSIKGSFHYTDVA